jgi:hypothetical protein
MLQEVQNRAWKEYKQEILKSTVNFSYVCFTWIILHFWLIRLTFVLRSFFFRSRTNRQKSRLYIVGVITERRWLAFRSISDKNKLRTWTPVWIDKLC